jgi:hypothetical protein
MGLYYDSVTLVSLDFQLVGCTFSWMTAITVSYFWLFMLSRHLAQISWDGQVDRQEELLFQVAGMLWQVILMSLHDHAQLMQALGHFVGPQVLREAHQ